MRDSIGLWNRVASRSNGVSRHQYPISLGNNKRLDATGFAPFGKVVYGMDAVKKLHAGYRDRPDQQLIQLEGNAYLQREFPNLDYIEHAVLEEK